MERLLLNLLASDSATIQEATKELKKVLQNPDSVPALCQLVVTSSNPEVRQYATLILRRRYTKGKYWTKLSIPVRTEFKKIILQALEHESANLVRNSIAQLIGVIVKHELPTNSWPEIIHYVQQLITNERLENKELGLYTLSIMTDVTPDAYSSHARSLVMLLAQTLSSLQNLGNPAAFYILETLRHLIPVAKHDETTLHTYTTMMPLIMTTIQTFTEAEHNDFAVQSFELLDELCEMNMIVVITPHVKSLVHMCLTIIANKSINELLKIKVISFIGWLARLKKKALVKHKLVESIVDMLFAVMMSKPEEDDDCSNTNNGNTVLTSITQTLDLLAMHLPPEKLIPHLLRHIEPGLRSTDDYVKKTSYVVIAVLAEGCAEYIRSNYLEFFLRCICEGISYPSPVVRNAALYALGQYSEHLQPEISQYSSELLPVLFEYLGQICSYIKQEKKEPHAVGRMFYALEMFCENLNEKILPYLPKLMERLFDILNADTSPHVKELTLSAVGAAACASEEHMLPYFETIINILNNYLTTEPSEKNMCLQIQAVDTLGVVARSIGEKHFAPLAATSLDLGIKLLRNTVDPDLRKSLYGLFAAISTIMKKEMAVTLPEIVEYMIMSIRSADGILMHFKDDETNALTVYDDLSDTENEREDEEEDIECTDNEDDDEEVEGYTVENAYMEEKEESVMALKEIAEHTEEAFMPYLERSFEEIFKLINYPQEDIRKASIEALLQFCINLSKINTDEGKKALLKALSMFIPKLSELIRLDEEPTVAICGLEAYQTLLRQVKSDVIAGIGHKEAIVNCVMDVMKDKTACQDQEEIEGIDIEAEQDGLLIECAGTVFSHLGRVLSAEDFALYFQTMLPFFLKRLKMDNSEAQRSFAVGTISECLSGLKHMTAAFVSQLLPTFLQTGAQDPCSEVRSNCFFGIGELALYGKEAVYPHYPNILQTLSCAIAKETDAAARDNVVGAIARLIITNYSNLPLEQVFPVFVEQLPLKADFLEHKAVFQSILTLYQAGVTLLQSYIHTLLKVAVIILHEEKALDVETQNLVMEFIKSVQRDFVNDWNALFTELPPEVVTNIQRIFS
ncbi:PREDICTED: importin-4-like isoform X1 [Acromyrmex echinatior]|uniref:Importin-4 n=2 Tax=Acromyrmex echinatior TaxID=103372 RepID=F4X776_ACREC|nr:PREDICTED: importin-4-like isoform X1 [Acromyrmex echinatior]EGI57688.1 Importin-4 [Acromyrmex echinatior]